MNDYVKVRQLASYGAALSEASHSKWWTDLDDIDVKRSFARNLIGCWVKGRFDLCPPDGELTQITAHTQHVIAQIDDECIGKVHYGYGCTLYIDEDYRLFMRRKDFPLEENCTNPIEE